MFSEKGKRCSSQELGRITKEKLCLCHLIDLRHKDYLLINYLMLLQMIWEQDPGCGQQEVVDMSKELQNFPFGLAFFSNPLIRNN